MNLEKSERSGRNDLRTTTSLTIRIALTGLVVGAVPIAIKSTSLTAWHSSRQQFGLRIIR